MRGLRVVSPVLAVALLVVAAVQAQRRGDGTTVRGSVVRITPTGNSFVVRVDGGKEVTLYGGPRSTYRLGERTVRFQDIRQGMYVTAPYETSGDRYIVGAVTLSESARDERPRGEFGAGIRGRVVKAHSDPNHLIVRTEDGKEIILYLVDGAMSFTFETREGKRVLTSMTTAAVRAGQSRATSAEVIGTVIRVAGKDNQFVVRTADGKEVIFYADPKAVYDFDGREGAFSDLREGVVVGVGFNVREGRHFAHRISARPRR